MNAGEAGERPRLGPPVLELPPRSGELSPAPRVVSRVANSTISWERSNGRSRMSTAFTRVKTVVLTPMPSASAGAATRVNHRSLDQHADGETEVLEQSWEVARGYSPPGGRGGREFKLPWTTNALSPGSNPCPGRYFHPLRAPARSRGADRAGQRPPDPARATRSATGFAHWPIWIFVFFIAPGPLTFDLFERGFDSRMVLWLGVVLLGTGIAGLRGQLPGVEPRRTSSASPRTGPIRSTGASATRWRGARRSPSPCSTSPGWRCDRHRHVAAPAALRRRTFPIVGDVWVLGALGQLPRVKRRRRARDTSGATSTDRCGRWRSRSRSWACCGRCCRRRGRPT